MALEWHYLMDNKPTGPVDLDTLRERAKFGTLGATDLIFGPGLTDWTPAGRVPGIFPPAAQVGIAAASVYPASAAGSGMLGYRGIETGTANLSPTAAEMLRQTKPWTRFIAILTFIVGGFMLLGGLFFVVVMAAVGMRYRTGVPPALGVVYVALGALYFAPAIYLNRYASKIADVLRTNGMRDLEQALQAQKSFWKFAGIMLLIFIVVYAIAIVAMLAGAMRF